MSFTIDIDLNSRDLRRSKAGVSLLISGTIYSARDAAHKRLAELVAANRPLPIEFKDKLIYYMGPSPTRKGYASGSAGPTSSYRMDDYLEMTLKLGVAGTIGKGTRADFVRGLCIQYKAPYLLTIGGAGAYLAQCIKSSRVVAFEDLGAEAINELVVENFPVIIGIDFRGNIIFK